MTRVVTEIALPPGELSEATMEALLGVVLSGGWIAPDRWGHIRAMEPLPAGTDPDRLRVLMDGFRRHGDLELSEGNGRATLSVVPDRFGQRTFTRYVAWSGPATSPCLDLAAHPETVRRIMELVRSPFAFAAAEEAVMAFRGRMVRDHLSAKMVPTVGSYARGLEHPHWRMWFGPEYVAFFGRETLAAAPAHVSQALDGIHFVQLCERPEDWDQPAAREAVRRFVAALGRCAFYDPEDPERPLEAPDFSHLGGGALPPRA